jgi:CheY-like chemotaxis protein
MALRILLADESLNVKKNLQIALQDYGVDVKSLLSGDDVIPSIRIFKPEIIFLDILLAKISGYDICAQIKNNPDLRHIPVVLIWSNFMHIDESKAKQCRADSTLEKPFDKDTIRKLIQHFVPKTVNQTLNEFLKMPSLLPPETNFDISYTNIKPISALTQASPTSQEREDSDEFVSKPTGAAFTKSVPEISPLTSSQDEPEDWSQKSLNVAMPQVNPMTQPSLGTPRQSNTGHSDRTLAGFQAPPKPAASNQTKNTEATAQARDDEYDVEIANVPLPNDAIPDEELMEGAMDGSKKARRHPMMKEKGVPIAPLTLDEKHLEEIIRVQIHENIQHWIKKYMPEVAERLIKNEIDRLMKDLDKEVAEGGPQ